MNMNDPTVLLLPPGVLEITIRLTEAAGPPAAAAGPPPPAPPAPAPASAFCVCGRFSQYTVHSIDSSM